MRITESQLRRIIREALSTVRYRHSQGWIDPNGDYHYDPDLSDHGEWAIRWLSENGMADRIIDGVRAVADLDAGVNSIAAIPDDLEYVVSDVATGILQGMGWGKVINAYTLAVKRPRRAVIERWLELGMEAGVEEREPFTVYMDDDILVKGDMYEVEDYARRLRG